MARAKKSTKVEATTKKNSQKKTKKESESSFSQILKFAINNKLKSLVVFIIILIVAAFGYSRYLDWDNRKELEAHKEDLSKLMDGLTAQGIDSVVNCGKSGSGKFGGVSDLGCGLTLNTNRSLNVQMLDGYVDVVGRNNNGTSYNVEYRSGDSICTIEASNEGAYSKCFVAVRGANEDYARELFSN